MYRLRHCHVRITRPDGEIIIFSEKPKTHALAAAADTRAWTSLPPGSVVDIVSIFSSRGSEPLAYMIVQGWKKTPHGHWKRLPIEETRRTGNPEHNRDYSISEDGDLILPASQGVEV